MAETLTVVTLTITKATTTITKTVPIWLDAPSATMFAAFGWIVVLGLAALTLYKWFRARKGPK